MRAFVPLATALGATAFALLAGCSSTPSPIGIAASQYQPLGRNASADNGRPRPAEILNQFNTLPNTTQPTNFEVVLQGNLVADICGFSNPPCLEQPLYGPYNPFCPPSHGPSNPCYPIVTYDPTTNTTTVSFAGPTLYLNVPSHPGMYHFGLFRTYLDAQSLKPAERTSYWSYPSSPVNPQPIVSINLSTVRSSSQWKYAVVYVEVSLKPGGQAAYGTWTEMAYVPKGTTQPHFTFTNYGTQLLYVTRSGIMPNQPVPTDPACFKNPACPEDMTLLGQLNFAGDPPPGDPGSQFQPLTYPPAKVLKPTKPH